MKSLVVFDLDGTLAQSKAAIDDEMAGLLTSLLEVVRVAIISGGAWPQFQTQVLAHLPTDDRLKNLSILPTCGTRYYRYQDGWNQLYADDLSTAEQHQIIDALEKAVNASGYQAARTWGDTIENRQSQITFSALGQEAPLNEKVAWDPDFAKRQKIKALLDVSLANFSVRLGGSTSIDVTKPGIDKAYGIRKLRDILNVAEKDMIYVGDALFPGGQRCSRPGYRGRLHSGREPARNQTRHRSRPCLLRRRLLAVPDEVGGDHRAREELVAVRAVVHRLDLLRVEVFAEQNPAAGDA